MKIRPVGAELFQADGRTDRQTDMTKLMVFFPLMRTRLERLSVLTDHTSQVLSEKEIIMTC
jgi:hypothetical protein